MSVKIVYFSGLSHPDRIEEQLQGISRTVLSTHRTSATGGAFIRGHRRQTRTIKPFIVQVLRADTDKVEWDSAFGTIAYVRMCQEMHDWFRDHPQALDRFHRVIWLVNDLRRLAPTDVNIMHLDDDWIKPAVDAYVNDEHRDEPRNCCVVV